MVEYAMLCSATMRRIYFHTNFCKELFGPEIAIKYDQRLISDNFMSVRVDRRKSREKSDDYPRRSSSSKSDYKSDRKSRANPKLYYDIFIRRSREDLSERKDRHRSDYRSRSSLDQVLDRILDLTLDTDLMTDHHPIVTVLSHITGHPEMTDMTGQDMTNTGSHTTILFTEEVVNMMIGLKRTNQTTKRIETAIVLKMIERTPPITILGTHLDLLITEATLEIDPLADMTTGTGLETTLKIKLEISRETSRETSPETSHGAEKNPLVLTPLWK